MCSCCEYYKHYNIALTTCNQLQITCDLINVELIKLRNKKVNILPVRLYYIFAVGVAAQISSNKLQVGHGTLYCTSL